MVNIGALTNKITALSYRSWDLYNVNFRTTTDEYFIGKTSNKILRVLKKHSHQKNYFWITDIERFKYDSLTHQRITKLNFKTKKNIFFIHPFFRRTAIFGSNLNKSIFSIINKHIDITTKANKIKLMDIYSSFKPNSLIFSDIVIKEDQNIIFLIDYSVLTLSTEFMTKISQYKNEPNFYFYTFGNSNFNWIKNLGPLNYINNVIYSKINPLLNTLDDLSVSHILVCTNLTNTPIKEVYDFCVRLNLKSNLIVTSKDINTSLKYSTLNLID